MKVVALISGLIVEVEVLLVIGFIVKLVVKREFSGWTLEMELMVVSSGLMRELDLWLV